MGLLAYRVQALCDKGQLQEALQLLQANISNHRVCSAHLHDRHADVFIPFLKACREARAIDLVKRAHALITFPILLSSAVLGDQLVSALAKCGALDGALTVLSTLPYRSAHSWTAMICGYNAYGRYQEALEVQQYMKKDGVALNENAVVSLLRACALIRDLEQGESVFSDAIRRGFITNSFVLNGILNIYIKSKCLLEAEIVFIKVSERDIVSWSIMISAYVEQGDIMSAVYMYVQLFEEGFEADGPTFVAILSACASLMDTVMPEPGIVVEVGKALHADARRKGYTSDPFVGGALVNLYGKCGCILHAEHVFDGLSEHDVVLSSSLLSAYVDQGEYETALQFYSQILHEGTRPCEEMFVISLRACANSVGGDKASFAECEPYLLIGRALYADSLRKGKVSAVVTYGESCETLIGDHLIFLLTKCGALDEAHKVLLSLPYHSIYSWTAVICGYSEVGNGFKALGLKADMMADGIEPDQHVIVSLLQACILESDLQEAMKLHTTALMKDFVSDVCVGSTLLAMYGSLGNLSELENVFAGLPVCDVVTWSVMLSSLMSKNEIEKVLQLFMEMHEQGIAPDEGIFVLALQACAALKGKPSLMTEEVQYIQASNSVVQERNCFLSGLLIPNTMYVKELDFQIQNKGVYGSIESLQVAFPACDNLLDWEGSMVGLEFGQVLHAYAYSSGYVLESSVNNSAISMYAKCGSILEAENVFNGISFLHDVVSWNAMLSAYVEQGLQEKAINLHSQMRQEGMPGNDITMMIVLEACRLTQSMDTCKRLYHDLVVGGYDHDISFAKALIRVCGACGLTEDAQLIFDRLHNTDVALWKACIRSHVLAEDSKTCLQVFDRMQLAGVTPDESTFLMLLSACSRTGLISRGFQIFESMRRIYHIVPDTKLNKAIASILGRAGQLEAVADLLQQMPSVANWGSWMSLLGACCTYGNVNLGVVAFDYIVNVKPMEVAAYVLMAQIYSDAGVHHHIVTRKLNLEACNINVQSNTNIC